MLEENYYIASFNSSTSEKPDISDILVHGFDQKTPFTNLYFDPTEPNTLILENISKQAWCSFDFTSGVAFSNTPESISEGLKAGSDIFLNFKYSFLDVDFALLFSSLIKLNSTVKKIGVAGFLTDDGLQIFGSIVDPPIIKTEQLLNSRQTTSVTFCTKNEYLQSFFTVYKNAKVTFHNPVEQVLVKNVSTLIASQNHGR